MDHISHDYDAPEKRKENGMIIWLRGLIWLKVGSYLKSKSIFRVLIEQQLLGLTVMLRRFVGCDAGSSIRKNTSINKTVIDQ